MDGWLKAYSDQEAAELLRQGFEKGFRLGYQGPRVRRWADNLKSTNAHWDIVQGKLDKEVKEGRMAGPFFD